MAAAAAAAAEKATGVSKNSSYKTHLSTGRILLIGKRRREGWSRMDRLYAGRFALVQKRDR